MATKINMKIIGFQDSLRSKPVRENFTSSETEINTLIDEVDAIVAPTAGNEISNGDFALDTAWVKGTGWTISGGTGNKASGSASDLDQTAVITIGQEVTVTFTLSAFVGGTITPRCGTTLGTARSANGTYTETISTAGNTTFSMVADSSGDYSIDNVIVNGSEIENARIYNPSLRDRLDYTWQGQYNYLISGGNITINASVDKIDIDATRAVVDGRNMNLTAATSAAITASAGGKHRIDLVVVQSDNEFKVITGTELDTSNDPLFPVPTKEQMTIGCLYVDSSAIDLTTNIYHLKADNHLPNYFYKLAIGLKPGKYVFNNLIVDNTLSCNARSGDALPSASVTQYSIHCTGNFFLTANGTGVSDNVTTFADADTNADNGAVGDHETKGLGASSGFENISNLFSGNGALGYNGAGASGAGEWWSGGGGGGGASIVSSGADGGDGVDGGASPLGNDVGGGGLGGIGTSCFILQAQNIDIANDFSFTGATGSVGTSSSVNGGAGGGGGGAGGGVLFIAVDDIDISVASTIDVSGGTGGQGENVTPNPNTGGGGGGGGGAGGLILLRYRSFTNSGSLTTTLTGGTGGTGGTANVNGSNGSNGSAGQFDQNAYDNVGSTLEDGFMPLNSLPFQGLGLGNGRML